MQRKPGKINYPILSGLKNIMKHMTALRIDSRLLKKCFLSVMLVHLSLFIVVLPSCSTMKDEEKVKNEDKQHSLSTKVRQKPKVMARGPGKSGKRLNERRALSPSMTYAEADEEQAFGDDKRHNTNWNTEEYSKISENPFLAAKKNPLSTFSIDVDTASYANVRRFLSYDRMPPVDAVRIEELINYFDYDYPEPEGKHPFSIRSEIAQCPWKSDHKLVRIGIQGKKLQSDETPPSNLVFLLDVSGSMSNENKLPLLKKAFKLLVRKLSDDDRVSIVVYAGAAGLVLPATDGDEMDEILEALDRLEAGGSTAGSAGIRLAYRIAEENFLEDGNNRIILATDGDFNVGVSSTSELTRMIEEKRKKEIYLTILGFGMGNYKDGRMEQIADKGNGNYYYIDNLMEAKKVLVNDLTGTLFTIAKDVKIQVEFNPAKIKAYRLIGYENRLLRKEDFNDDKKDAGELGAGHNVTALYEIVPVGIKADIPDVDELEFQKTAIKKAAYQTDEIMKVKFRYKPPKSDRSILIVHRIKESDRAFKNCSENFRFATAVASFGMMLRDSKHKGNMTYNKIIELADDAMDDDEYGYRAEFIELVKRAKKMDKKQR